MKKIVAISVGILLALGLISSYFFIFETKQAVFNLSNGVIITTTLQYNKIAHTATATAIVENKWLDNGFIDFFNPEVLTVNYYAENGYKVADVHYKYRGFQNYGNYYEGTKSTKTLPYSTFKYIKKVEIETVISKW